MLKQLARGLLSVLYLGTDVLRPGMASFSCAAASTISAMILVKQNHVIPVSHPTNGLADGFLSDFGEANRPDSPSNVLEEYGTVAALARP